METPKKVTLKERRTALEARVVDSAGAFANRSGLATENSPDTLDMICMSADRDVLVQRMNVVARMPAEVRKTLIKMESGDCGVFEECEESFRQRRLNAILWAGLCVKGQEARDRQSVETLDGVSMVA